MVLQMFRVKVLGIAASPRKGNTEILIREALGAAKSVGDVETEFVSLHGKKINPCLDCRACERNKSLCVQKDDMQKIYPKLIEADGIIIGSPVYMSTVSGQLKALMDRTTCLFKSEYDPSFPIKVDFTKKVGGAIAVGYDRYGGVEYTIQTIINYFLSAHMVVVSGYTPNAYIGGAAWQMLVNKLDAVKQDEIGIKAAREVGERVAKTAKLLKLGLENMKKK